MPPLAWCTAFCAELFFIEPLVSFQGNAAFFDAVTRELPTKTREEILQHEQWYVEFCALLESKQAAIEAWREEKQVK